MIILCMEFEHFLQNIDEELKVATEAFFESESCTIDLARREVLI